MNTVDDMTPADALKVGIAQCFALVRGTSRSGSTIIGGMLFGLSRQTRPTSGAGLSTTVAVELAGL